MVLEDRTIVSSSGVDVDIRTFHEDQKKVSFASGGKENISEGEGYFMFINRVVKATPEFVDGLSEGSKIFTFDKNGILELAYGPVEEEEVYSEISPLVGESWKGEIFHAPEFRIGLERVTGITRGAGPALYTLQTDGSPNIHITAGPEETVRMAEFVNRLRGQEVLMTKYGNDLHLVGPVDRKKLYVHEDLSI